MGDGQREGGGLGDTCRERGCIYLPWASEQHEVTLPEKTMCFTLLTLLVRLCLAWAIVSQEDSYSLGSKRILLFETPNVHIWATSNRIRLVSPPSSNTCASDISL